MTTSSSPGGAGKGGGPLRNPWVRRGRLGAVVVVGLVLLYAVLAGGILPPVLRSQAEKRLSALAGAPVSIGRLSFQPFLLRARVGDLQVREPDGSVLLSWSNVVADAAWSTLWRGEAVLDSVFVDRLHLAVRRGTNGELNLVELAHRFEAASGAGSGPKPAATTNAALPAFDLGHFTFTNGSVQFEDRSLAEPFKAGLESLHFELAGLGSRAGREGELELVARGDGGEVLRWTARIGLAPPSVEGRIEGERVHLGRPRPYADRVSSLAPTNGLVSFRVPFRVSLPDGTPEIEVTGAGVTVEDLALVQGRSNVPFAEVRRLEVSGVAASLARREGRVGSLVLDGGRWQVRRTPVAGQPKRSETNLKALLRPEAVEVLIRDLTDWRLGIDSAEIRGVSVEFTDTALAPAVQLEVPDVGLRLEKLSNASNAPPARLSGNVKLPGDGRLTLAAEGTALPTRARASVGLERVDLAAAAPYVAQFLRLDLKRGLLGATLEARYGGGTPSEPLLQAGGSLAVTNLAALETGTGTDFIRWEAVELNGLKASLEPSGVSLDELVVRRLQTSLVLGTNGQLNVLQLIRETRELGQPETEKEGEAGKAPAPGAGNDVVAAAPPGTAPAPAQGAAPAAAAAPFWEEWPVRLGALKLEQVSLFAADQFYGGGFRTSIESLDGQVRNLALPPTEPAAVDLKGRLTASSGFTLTGTVNPDPKAFATDLTLSARRADLKQVTPYSLRFAGYPVTRGELTADVRYQVRGDALEAENKLVLDQFTLGPKTPSPDAVDLPLKLGVALLKDADGRIQLDVPLRGSLGDPQFRVAPLVWQVIRNLVVKAATAPFKFLGSLFGGGGDEELEFVEFAPGTDLLTGGQTNRLRTLAKALAARPQLSLVLLPGFDADADRPVLARARVEGRLRKIRSEEIATTGAPQPPPETVELTPADRERLAPILFTREFGALPTNPPPGSGTAPQAAAPPESAPTAGAAPWTPSQLLQRLVETTVLEPADFRALGTNRVERVRTWLTGEGQLAADRVSMDATATNHVAEGRDRVAFRLE